MTPSEEISQTLWRASKATAASLICPHGPPALPVVPGRNPDVQVAPPSVDVTKPMLDDPPPDTRPVWKAETMVVPKANVSGSTSVRCWACVSVNGSVLTWVTATFAEAGVAATRSPPTTTAGRSAAVRTLRG